MKLHLGCGWRNFGKDWIHIDGGNYEHLYSNDITKLPFEDNSVDLIYASHVLEYFDRIEVVSVLMEWMRVLKVNGTLRIAVPDFESMSRLYCDGMYPIEAFLGPLYGRMKMGEDFIYHKTVYDFKSLETLLKKCGFDNVERYDWKQTEHKDYDDHSQCYLPHMDKENGVLLSLNLECVKPFVLNEKKIYSQNGEDGIIEDLLNKIGIKNKFFVEFGVYDGNECNSKYFREYHGFDGVCWDGDFQRPEQKIFKEFVTAENINELFQKYNIPDEFDFLSIDIDYNDLWVWKALDEKYKPNLVVVEYNCAFPPPISLTVPYDALADWDHETNYMGASLSALSKLATEKGYTLIYCDNIGVNSFFIRNDLFEKLNIKKGEDKHIYKKGKFGGGPNGGHRQHPENKKMIEY